MFKLSQFTVHNLHNADEVAIFNTLTNAFAIVERNPWELCLMTQRWKDHPHWEELMQYGFIVPQASDEYQTFLLHRNKVKFYSGHLSFTVLTTLTCNLACTYCMQGQVRIERDSPIGSINAPEVSEFIRKVINEYKPHNVTITYFGGEPLVNMNGIEEIYHRLQDTLPANTQLSQIMITNGTLVSRYIERIRQCNIATLQITLDGPPEIHNARRIRASGNGSFDEVVSGVSTALDAGLFVAIHVVVDAHNAPHIKRLAEFLHQRFGDYIERFAINVGLASNPGWDSRHCALYISDARTTAGQFVQAIRAALGAGLQIVDFLISSPCPRERDNEFIIAPDGSLKCISAVGREAFFAGTIKDSPLIVAQKSAPLINFLPPGEECHLCPYLPDCNGGCRFNAWVKTGDIYSLDCWKDFYAEAMPSLLALYAQTRATVHPSIRKTSVV